MRFGLTDVPFWTLLFLPLYLTYHGYGFLAAIFFLTLWLALRIAINIYSLKRRGRDNRIVLQSLGASPYVEKVRWCMDKLGTTYEEDLDIGAMGAVLAGRMVPTLTIPGKNLLVPNSADILRFLYGMHGTSDKAKFLCPTEEAVALEAKCDALGYDLRQWRYYQTLIVSDKSDDLILKLWGYYLPGVPQWQKVMLPIIMPALKLFVRRGLNISLDEAMKGLTKAKAFFQETDKLLSDGRKYLLNTEEPTFVDYTFACMASMLCAPDGYGGRVLPDECKVLLEDLPPGAQKEIREFRKTPSGKFTTRMFQEHRLK